MINWKINKNEKLNSETYNLFPPENLKKIGVPESKIAML